MQLCVFSPALADMSLDAALSYLKGLGVDALELGVGGYPGTARAWVAGSPKTLCPACTAKVSTWYFLFVMFVPPFCAVNGGDYSTMPR